MQLSRLDYELLRELQADARKSKKELAKKLGVSAVTVAAHISRLEKLGVILRYVTILNPDAFGLSLEAAIEISVQGGHIVEVEKELSKNPSVYAVYDVTGDSDVLIFTRFRSRDELSKFVKSVLGNPYVLRTNTRLILTTIKRSLEIPFSNDSEKKARKASS